MPQIMDIINNVCRHYGVKQSEIKRKKRGKYNPALHATCCLLYKHGYNPRVITWTVDRSYRQVMRMINRGRALKKMHGERDVDLRISLSQINKKINEKAR